MSHAHIARFPHQSTSKNSTTDHHAAEQARKRIADLPDQYQHYAPSDKEQLVGVVQPISVAAESEAMAAPGIFRKRVVSEPVVPEMPDLVEPTELPAEHFEEPAANQPSWRRLLSRFRPLLIGLATFVLIFLIYKAPIFLSQLSYLTSDKAATSTAQNSPQVGPNPVISIPKINVTAPIVFATSNVEANIQKDLESGVVHYANTANPGEPGNSVIFGHSSNDWWEPGNYKFVFVLLDRLVVGDTFTVNYNSKQYVYQVTETKIVEPNDLSVLNSDGTHQLTLITCSPPGTSWRRLIVKSKQISPEPTTTAVAVQNHSDFDGKQLTGTSTNLAQQFADWWRKITGGSQ